MEIIIMHVAVDLVSVSSSVCGKPHWIFCNIKTAPIASFMFNRYPFPKNCNLINNQIK